MSGNSSFTSSANTTLNDSFITAGESFSSEHSNSSDNEEVEDKTIIENLPDGREAFIREYVGVNEPNIRRSLNNKGIIAKKNIHKLKLIIQEPSTSNNRNGKNINRIDISNSVSTSSESEISQLESVRNPNFKMAAADNNLAELIEQLGGQPEDENPAERANRNIILKLARNLQELTNQQAPNEVAPVAKLNLIEARSLAAEGGGAVQHALTTSDLLPTRWTSVEESGSARSHINSCEDYFQLQGYKTSPQKLPWFKTTLGKEARTWMEDRESTFRDWQHLKQEFTKYWDKTPCKDVALRQFRSTIWDQKEMADKYLQRINKSARILGYGEDEVLQQFQFGLPMHAKIFFASNKPQTLEAAVEKLQNYADTVENASQTTLSALSNNPFLPQATSSEQLLAQVLHDLVPLATGGLNKTNEGKSEYKKEVKFEEKTRTPRERSEDRSRDRNRGRSRDSSRDSYRNSSRDRFRDSSRDRFRGNSRNTSGNRYSDRSYSRDRTTSRSPNTESHMLLKQQEGIKAANELAIKGAMLSAGALGYNNNWQNVNQYPPEIMGSNYNYGYKPINNWNTGNRQNFGGRGKQFNDRRTNSGYGNNFKSNYNGPSRQFNNNNGRSGNSNGRPSSNECFSCGSTQHFARNCPKGYNNRSRGGRQNSNPSF